LFLLTLATSGVFRIWQKGDSERAGSLGAEPSAGSRGRAPGRGSRGLPPEAETLFAFERSMKAANSPIILKFGNAANHRYLRFLSKK